MSEPGFVYVLRNKSHGANVVKIGLTTRSPDVRAREIYQGSSGVPLPFTVAVAFSVADCKKAEKMIHGRLAAYRVNKRREFFRVPLQIAEGIVGECCAAINHAMGENLPERIAFPAATRVAERDSSWVSDNNVEMLPVKRIKQAPLGENRLTPTQIDRVNIVFSLLEKMSPLSQKKFVEGFIRDEFPEGEIRIWEHMAKAYLTIENGDIAPESFRREAFELLFNRTLVSSYDVLKNARLENFSRETARALLDEYDLPPIPILVRRLVRTTEAP